MERPDLLVVRSTGYMDDIAIQLDFYFIAKLLSKLTLRPFDNDFVAGVYLSGHICGKLNRKSAYS